MKMTTPTLVTSCTALPPEGAAASRGGPWTRRRVLLPLAAAVLLAGCGFQLRQAPEFAFDAISIRALPTSPIAAELRRRLAAESRVRVLTSPVAPAASAAAAVPTVVLDVVQEQREKVVVGLSATGQVREFQLRTRLKFTLRTPQGRELIPETELLQQRDIGFNEAAVLAKESEEALLYRDMQADIVQQLMRRLAALKAL
ncbi:MAG: rlpB [Ramlibacter sp.]|uniref:LPS-assembly lipoprotein LptE n=1 Tax=Ramlibacter sp. TaxID=1917967 RepID=UPI00260F008A|nr:LPS assembly lipoprotein LptE [Ramlibacter sp.]MDB5749872.1 rlpB [Ramlibacter sp.]